MKYFIDFETKSSLDLTKVGTERYLHTTESDIVCMSYWHENLSNAKIWLPHQPFPFKLQLSDEVYAFNIQFDQRVWNVLGEKYGLPKLHLFQCIDVMALCGRYGYPQSLAKVGKVLKLQVQKRPLAKKLMKKICSPPFKYTVGELKEFLLYCIDDTRSMRDLLYALPADHLSSYDQEIWELTAKVNRTGLPIDVPFVAKVNVYLKKEKEEACKRLSLITDGAITTPGQRDRIIKFCNDYDLYIDNLQADTVDDLLDQEIPETVREVLEIRKIYGKAALSKYVSVMNLIYKGRIFDNLRFYGGHTGRWAGLGFQAHNMFRGDPSIDQDEEIEKIMTGKCFNVTKAARPLVRGIVKAPKKKTFCIADYKSIENVTLAFAAGEEYTLHLYEAGKDEYKDFASTFFRIPYEKVDKDKRTFSKPVILGAGYGLGGKGLLSYAEGYGVVMTMAEAEAAIQIYRQSHPNIVRFWYRIHECFKLAILQPGKAFSYRGISIKVVKDRTGKNYAVLNLLSGRNLFYPSPKLETNIFGNPGPTYMSWNLKYNKWIRTHISPGHLTENIIQGLAFDLLVNGKSNLIEANYQVDLSIHDEVIVELDEEKATTETYNDIIRLMCNVSSSASWAIGLPLGAEGEFSKRYKKI